MKRGELLHALEGTAAPEWLEPVYGRDAAAAAGRLRELVEEYAGTFPCRSQTQTLLFSAPGRTELGGNHTDHQRGRALAGSVDLDTIACVVPNDSGVIRVKSRHHRMAEVELSDLSPRPEEADSSVSLVRGIAAKVRQLGYPVGGFDAYTTTRVLRGSGLSSSAAFEVLVGTILNHLSCGGALTPVQVARIGQFAENTYYGKPCGLMDQLACAVGGVIAIDFRGEEGPALRRIRVDLAARGHALCIVDSRGDHGELTEDYAAIPREMGAVAAQLGGRVLSEVDFDLFRERLPALRAACGDRAVLRAYHFFEEDRRVPLQWEALERGDLEGFLRLARRSGRSSFMYLQNVSTYRDSRVQPLALLLAAAEELLAGRGACRVHGGGFAGTIQAVVPFDLLDGFVEGMDALAGAGACHVVSLRGMGAVRLI